MKNDDLSKLYEIIRIIDNNHELLYKNHWRVTRAEAYEWWDGLDSAEKIVISAILVQQTRWEVAKSATEKIFKIVKNIQELKNIDEMTLLEAIRGVSFPKRKIYTIKEFSNLVSIYNSLDKLLTISNRNTLLGIKGIGEETADSILLFAGNQKVFPISNYLKRIFSRIFIKPPNKNLILQVLNDNLYYYKLLHAGIVSVGRSFCKVLNPDCKACIFKDLCYYFNRRV
ncbi:MAG: endonuclease III domain-containing protein [Sulfolobaceae archaeon]